METLSVPDELREKLGDAGSNGLMTMFADAQRLAVDAFGLQLAGLEGRLGQRFDAIDRRFELIDRRFEQVDRRFEQVDGRFGQIDHKFELFEARIERRLEQTKVEILRWSFLFWATQFAAFMGVLSFVLRR
jgi:hypothetical protein